MERPKVLSVPEAGRWLKLGRSAAYEAARRGDLPVLRIGRKLLVPVARLRAMLGEGYAAPDDGGDGQR